MQVGLFVMILNVQRHTFPFNMKSKEELLHQKMHLELGLALEEKKKEIAKDLEALKKGDKFYFGVEIFVLISMIAGYIYALFFMRGIAGALLSVPLLWASMNQFMKLKERWSKRKEIIKAFEEFMKLDFPIHEEEKEPIKEKKLSN